MIAKPLQKSFEFALNDAIKRRHEYVTLEHLLYALLHDREVADVVRQCGGDISMLKKQLEDFLNRTLMSINEQQAEKDYNVADFYRRTGHPGAAYFYYEVVRRRYAGSSWAEKAVQHMNEIRNKVETEKRDVRFSAYNPGNWRPRRDPRGMLDK